jgi:uncharacterized membrane protein YphA (DoxX/SURF4 family)
MKHMFSKCCNPGFGLMLVRIAAGAVFLAHGIAKLQNMEGTIAFFGMLGLASFWAYVVAIVETVGGVALILGFFTGVMGMLLAVTMVVAIFIVKLKVGFIVPGGYEIDLMLLAASLSVALAGPGKWALGRRMCGCDNCMVCGQSNTCDNCDTCKTGCNGHEMK